MTCLFTSEKRMNLVGFYDEVSFCLCFLTYADWVCYDVSIKEVV